MKKIIFILIIVFTISNSYAQSKKEIIQELTIENTNLKQEISTLNDKIASLNAEIASLKKELVVDKIETPQDYGKILFDLFVSQRLSKFPELQWQLNDSIYFINKQKFLEGINDIKNNAIDFYIEGSGEGIDWSKAKFKNVDFSIRKPNHEFNINYLKGRIFFEYQGREYSFRNEGSIYENGKWKGYYFNRLTDITKEKEEEQKRLNGPYIPDAVKFGIVKYNYYDDEKIPKTMFELEIPVENNTDYVIDWMKFQFRIYEDGKLLLSKNIIVSEYDGLDNKLEQGEKEHIKLKEIGEVYIKSGIKNGNWYSDVKLLEVKPKPSKE